MSNKCLRVVGISVSCIVVLMGLAGCKPASSTIHNKTTKSTPAITSVTTSSTLSGTITISSTTYQQAGWTLFPSGDQINDLITKGNEIWATTTGGVEEWDLTSGTCRLYTIQDGLPGDYIYSITRDNRGNIWCETGYGLARYTPNQP